MHSVERCARGLEATTQLLEADDRDGCVADRDRAAPSEHECQRQVTISTETVTADPSMVSPSRRRTRLLSLAIRVSQSRECHARRVGATP